MKLEKSLERLIYLNQLDLVQQLKILKMHILYLLFQTQLLLDFDTISGKVLLQNGEF